MQAKAEIQQVKTPLVTKTPKAFTLPHFVLYKSAIFRFLSKTFKKVLDKMRFLLYNYTHRLNFYAKVRYKHE